MKFRKAAYVVLFAVIAAVISVPLAIFSEGAALQLGHLEGTPGLFFALKLAPPDSRQGFDLMRKQMLIEVAIDAPICFLIICGIAVVIVRANRWRETKAVAGGNH